MSILLTLLMICVVTIVHEFGHFAAARLNGVKVLEFAVGMGPKVCGWQPGETAYTIRLFPIGGSCRMLGEEEAADDPRSFNNKAVWRRMTIILAGVFMNVVLAVVICFAYIGTHYYLEPVVTATSPDMPAEAAGILPGDRITAVNGAKTRLFDDVKLYLMLQANGKPLTLDIERGGEKIQKSVTPALVRDTAADGTVTEGYYIGVSGGAFAFGPFYGDEKNGRTMNLGETAAVSWYQTVSYVKSVVYGLGAMVSGKISPREAAGPIYMGKIISENNEAIMESEAVANKPAAIAWFMLQFAAIISANLAVVNLIPIPALDGGRFVIFAIEGIRRKPLNPERLGWVTFVSFALLMLLAVAVAFSDILKLVA